MTAHASSSPPRGRASLRATAIGGIAVVLWAALAVLTTHTGAVPPLLMVALSFGTAFAITLIKWLWRRESIGAHLRQPAGAWLLGVGGLFGYHFFYFVGLRNAPAVDASLIAYLWPLFIVLLSALLPGERLRWWHLAGAVCGLAGTFLLVTGGRGVSLRGEYLLGYGAAFVCSLTWSGYSVLNRRYTAVPTDAVGGMCAVTGALAVLCHLAFETTVWPSGVSEWLAVVALGVGPIGLAFFAWDYGTKHGDIRLLGVSSYAAPLLSTILLVTLGEAAATWHIAAACVLVVGGALLASLELLRRMLGAG
ncbi:aromatic amino acid exporter YddG [Haliangium sp.]|uniref:aromatic amino acid exporter YddG n=1 Tax=Haliangium sp. TaxID=2663208 RepID=UPI003D0D937C